MDGAEDPSRIIHSSQQYNFAPRRYLNDRLGFVRSLRSIEPVHTTRSGKRILPDCKVHVLFPASCEEILLPWRSFRIEASSGRTDWWSLLVSEADTVRWSNNRLLFHQHPSCVLLTLRVNQRMTVTLLPSNGDWLLLLKWLIRPFVASASSRHGSEQ